MTYPIIPPYPSFAWRDKTPIHNWKITQRGKAEGVNVKTSDSEDGHDAD